MDFATGLIWFVAFLLSTTVHEAMHAWAAWRGGDATAYHGGQVSLSPIPHIRREPIGMLLVPLLTSFSGTGWAIGWASAPYDPYWAARHPQRAALMAAAGPAGNFVIAAMAFALIKVGILSGWFSAPAVAAYSSVVVGPDGPDALTTTLSVFLMLNVILGTFNLLPLPPLDGGAVMTSVLPESARVKVRELTSSGAASLLGLVLAWRAFDYLAGPLFSIVLRTLHPEMHYASQLSQ